MFAIWAAWQTYRQQVGDCSAQSESFWQEFLVLGSWQTTAATDGKDTKTKRVLMKRKIAVWSGRWFLYRQDWKYCPRRTHFKIWADRNKVII